MRGKERMLREMQAMMSGYLARASPVRAQAYMQQADPKTSTAQSLLVQLPYFSRSQQRWRERLDALLDLIRSTSVPIFYPFHLYPPLAPRNISRKDDFAAEVDGRCENDHFGICVRGPGDSTN